MRSSFPLALCLEVVNLPMSSYYYHRAAVKRPDKYAYLRPVVVKICEDSGLPMAHIIDDLVTAAAKRHHNQ